MWWLSYYSLTAFRKSHFNKFVIISDWELNMMSLTVLLCDVYPDVLCSIDSIETKMVIIDVFWASVEEMSDPWINVFSWNK